jgi:hypothetical protein
MVLDRALGLAYHVLAKGGLSDRGMYAGQAAGELSD